MLFVLLAAAAAILGGVVAVVMGYGGELIDFRRDLPPIRFGLRTPTDVAMLRLPISMFGFQPYATGEALSEIAQMLADRDAEIAWLRDQVGQPSSPGPVGRLDPDDVSVPEALPLAGAADAAPQAGSPEPGSQP